MIFQSTFSAIAVASKSGWGRESHVTPMQARENKGIGMLGLWCEVREVIPRNTFPVLDLTREGDNIRIARKR
jgi:hypothetical protein